MKQFFALAIGLIIALIHGGYNQSGARAYQAQIVDAQTNMPKSSLGRQFVKRQVKEKDLRQKKLVPPRKEKPDPQKKPGKKEKPESRKKKK